MAIRTHNTVITQHLGKALVVPVAVCLVALLNGRKE